MLCCDISTSITNSCIQYHTSTRPSKCTDHLSRHWTQDLVPTCRLISFQGRLLHSWSLLRPEPAGLCWIRTSKWAFRACFNLDTSSGLQEPWPLAAQTQTDPLGCKTGHTHCDCSCACWSELIDHWSIKSDSDSCSNFITVSMSEVLSCSNHRWWVLTEPERTSVFTDAGEALL